MKYIELLDFVSYLYLVILCRESDLPLTKIGYTPRLNRDTDQRRTKGRGSVCVRGDATFTKLVELCYV